MPQHQSEQDPDTDEEAERNKKTTSDSRYSIQASRRKYVLETQYKMKYFGTLRVRKIETTTSFDGDHTHQQHAAQSQNKTEWYFLPSFVSRCIELHIRATSMSIFPSLRVCTVISDRDPLFSICAAEDGRTLRAYLENNRHRVDPYVVDDWGFSLFHVSRYLSQLVVAMLNRIKVAAQCKNYEACKVLLEYGLDPTSLTSREG